MTIVSEQEAHQLELIVITYSGMFRMPVVRKIRQQKFKDNQIRTSDNMNVRLIVVMTMAVCV
jgi:hypothetical protein